MLILPALSWLRKSEISMGSMMLASKLTPLGRRKGRENIHSLGDSFPGCGSSSWQNTAAANGQKDEYILVSTSKPEVSRQLYSNYST